MESQAGYALKGERTEIHPPNATPVRAVFGVKAKRAVNKAAGVEVSETTLLHKGCLCEWPNAGILYL